MNVIHTTCYLMGQPIQEPQSTYSPLKISQRHTVCHENKAKPYWRIELRLWLLLRTSYASLYEDAAISLSQSHSRQLGYGLHVTIEQGTNSVTIASMALLVTLVIHIIYCMSVQVYLTSECLCNFKIDRMLLWSTVYNMLSPDCPHV